MSNHPECRYAWTLRRMALPFPSGLVFCRLAGWQGFFVFQREAFTRLECGRMSHGL